MTSFLVITLFFFAPLIIVNFLPVLHAEHKQETFYACLIIFCLGLSLQSIAKKRLDRLVALKLKRHLEESK